VQWQQTTYRDKGGGAYREAHKTSHTSHDIHYHTTPSENKNWLVINTTDHKPFIQASRSNRQQTWCEEDSDIQTRWQYMLMTQICVGSHSRPTGTANPHPLYYSWLIRLEYALRIIPLANAAYVLAQLLWPHAAIVAPLTRRVS
jgi:hypothetical protein